MVGHVNFSELENFSNKGKKPFSQTKNAIKGAVGVAAGAGIAAAGAAASRQSVENIAMNLTKKANANPEIAEKIAKYLEKHPKVAEAGAKGILTPSLYERIKAWNNEVKDHPFMSAFGPSHIKERRAMEEAANDRVNALDKGISIGSKAAMIGGAATAGITGTAAIVKAIKAHKAKKLASKIK